MVTLSQREQQRVMVLNALDRGDLQMTEAADLLGLSTRQLRRLRGAYRREGPKALVHGNRGRLSPRRVGEPIRDRVVQLARTTYAGVNHAHFTELLAEREAIALSHPTVHRILREAGIRSPRRRRPPRHRRRRERMPQPGLLVQLDGSDHDWLEDRGPRLVLLGAVDDATGEVVAALFRDQEDAQGYLLLLRQIAERQGLPVAVYSDRHRIFAQTKPALTLEEELAGGPDPTHVARALAELGIRWIPASSPQAKGRIERLFGAFQDRLRSELRLAAVTDLAGANAFLPDFLARYNARFAHAPQRSASAFRPWPAGVDPETIFCFKYLRTVSNDNTVTLGPHLLQLEPGPRSRSYARARVELHERLDGSLAVFYHGRRLTAHLLTTPAPGPLRARQHRRVRPQGPASLDGLRARRRQADQRLKRNAPPPPNHPWRQLARQAVTLKAVREAGRTKLLNS